MIGQVGWVRGGKNENLKHTKRQRDVDKGWMKKYVYLWRTKLSSIIYVRVCVRLMGWMGR